MSFLSLEAFNGGFNAFDNVSSGLMRRLMILPTIMSLCVTVGNGSCIKCAFMTFWSSYDKFGQCKFIYSSFNMKKIIIIIKHMIYYDG